MKNANYEVFCFVISSISLFFINPWLIVLKTYISPSSERPCFTTSLLLLLFIPFNYKWGCTRWQWYYNNTSHKSLNQQTLTCIRSWALPEMLPVVQPFRKFPAILRNPMVHHRVHKSPPLIPILRQFDPVHTIPSYLSKIPWLLHNERKASK
jgi:hypothetical protein